MDSSDNIQGLIQDNDGDRAQPSDIVRTKMHSHWFVSAVVS